MACGGLALVLVAWFGRRPEEPPSIPIAAQPQVFFRQNLPPPSQELPRETEQKLLSCKLPVYELTIAEGDLRTIENTPYGNATYAATFQADGNTFSGARVRARGSWSRSWPKKSLKILLDHKHPFHGHHSLNLNSAWRDPALVREVLAYRVYSDCGVTASRAQMVRLQINGRFYGLYVDVEQPAKEFLAEHDLKGAELYKATSRSRDADERDLGDPAAYQGAYTKETDKTEGDEQLISFCQELARTTNVIGFFDQHVELDKYVNYLAATVLIQHWDGFNKNHYLAHDRQGSGKWQVIPWDLDRTFGDHWHMYFTETRLPVLLGTRAMPGVTGWNRLEESFLSEPALRLKVLDRLSELLEKTFTTEKLFPVLDELEKQIAPAAELDRMRWPGPAGDFHAGIAGVKSFIENRRTYLLKEIPKLRQQLR